MLWGERVNRCTKVGYQWGVYGVGVGSWVKGAVVCQAKQLFLGVMLNEMVTGSVQLGCMVVRDTPVYISCCSDLVVEPSSSQVLPMLWYSKILPSFLIQLWPQLLFVSNDSASTTDAGYAHLGYLRMSYGFVKNTAGSHLEHNDIDSHSSRTCPHSVKHWELSIPEECTLLLSEDISTELTCILS